jgi:outer membrane immunogenic protein
MYFLIFFSGVIEMSNFKHPLLFLMIATVISPFASAQAGSLKFSLDDFPDLDWSGTYLGANAGYLSSFKGTGSISAVVNGDINPNARGFTGGAYAGYNIQSGNFVYGPELDASLSSASGQKGASSNEDSISFKLKELNAFSLRGRFGYLFNDTLVYAATGLSNAGISYVETIKLGSSVTKTSTQKRHFGLTFGLGLDYALTPSVIARTEYRYTAYEQKSYPDYKIGADSHEFRAGLAYKF